MMGVPMTDNSIREHSEQIIDLSLKAEYFTKHYREEKATAEKGSAVYRSLELWTELAMKCQAMRHKWREQQEMKMLLVNRD